MPAPTPTTITITGTFSGSPQTLQLPAGIDFRQMMKNINLADGFWFQNAGVWTFAPASTITGATAQ
jgi:hypothetical protein